jgi:hypothetical protein
VRATEATPPPSALRKVLPSLKSKGILPSASAKPLTRFPGSLSSQILFGQPLESIVKENQLPLQMRESLDALAEKGRNLRHLFANARNVDSEKVQNLSRQLELGTALPFLPAHSSRHLDCY